jgi:hypothetical protein
MIFFKASHQIEQILLGGAGYLLGLTALVLSVAASDVLRKPPRTPGANT